MIGGGKLIVRVPSRYAPGVEYISSSPYPFVKPPPADVQADAALIRAARKVVRAYTAESEDWNDGTYALWRKDDLINALVELRQVVAVLPGGSLLPCGHPVSDETSDGIHNFCAVCAVAALPGTDT